MGPQRSFGSTSLVWKVGLVIFGRGLNCNIWVLVPKRDNMTKAPSNTKCQVLKTLRFHNAPASAVLSRSWLVHLSQESHEAATTITSILPMKTLQHGEIKWFSQSPSWSMVEAGFQFGNLTPEQVFLCHVTLYLSVTRARMATSVITVSEFFTLKNWEIWEMKISNIIHKLKLCGAVVESTCQRRKLRRCGSDSWVWRILWSRKWQPTPGFFPGESHGQRSLAGYSPWGQTELDMTEQLSTAHIVMSHLLTIKCIDV